MNEELRAIHVLIQQNRLEQAAEACRAYLSTRPDDSAALNFMAGIACELNQHDQAISVIEKLVAQFPDDAGLLKNLGYLYTIVGKNDDALECYRRALRASPQDPDSMNRIGALLVRQRRLPEALETLQNAKRLRPNLAITRRNLGEAFFCIGELSDASSEYQAALRLTPNDPVAFNGLGAVLVARGKHEIAIRYFEAALQSQRDFAEAEINLALTLTFAGRNDEAIAHGQQAIALKPDSSPAHASLAAAFRAAGDSNQAVIAFRKAIDIDPENREAYAGLGATLVDLGQFEEAVQQFEFAIQLDPNCGSAYYHLAELARLRQYTLGEKHLLELAGRAKNDSIPAEDRCSMYFSRAIALERQGEPTEAFGEYDNGNKVIHAWLAKNDAAFDAKKHHQLISNVIDTFDDSFFRRNDLGGSTDQTPIFVVGMPRSGTTLVEQIIASHPEAAGGGELPFIPIMARDLTTKSDEKLVYPASVKQLSSNRIRELADDYLAQLGQVDANAARVVDKMWVNFVYLGLIAVMFPKARIVNTVRSLMDVGLSCYCRRFVAVNFPWSWDLREIGAYGREYQRLMSHWMKVMPSRIHQVRYEDLVNDQEATSRKLIEFCGLDWSEQCARFYESERSVQTHSRVQVRQPIYRTSVEKWRQFEAELTPLYEELHSGAGEP